VKLLLFITRFCRDLSFEGSVFLVFPLVPRPSPVIFWLFGENIMHSPSTKAAVSSFLRFPSEAAPVRVLFEFLAEPVEDQIIASFPVAGWCAADPERDPFLSVQGLSDHQLLLADGGRSLQEPGTDSPPPLTFTLDNSFFHCPPPARPYSVPFWVFFQTRPSCRSAT